MKRKRVAILSIVTCILILSLVFGCRGAGGARDVSPSPVTSPEIEAPSTVAASGSFTLTSTAFRDGGDIPGKNAHKGARGQNLSLPLSWTKPPAGTRSFMIVMDDPDAHGFLHWCIFNIPADARSLSEGASTAGIPPGSIQIENSFGESGYGGPHPPRKHHYVITIYALSASLEGVNEGSSLADLMKSAEGKILGRATLGGFFAP